MERKCVVCKKELDDDDVMAWATSGLPTWRLACKDHVEKAKEAVRPFLVNQNK